MHSDAKDQTCFEVVVNDEEQYSIWPDYKPLPNGWYAVGKRGSKAECLEYIATVWTDLRARSLREAMEGVAGGSRFIVSAPRVRPQRDASFPTQQPRNDRPKSGNGPCGTRTVAGKGR